MHIAFNEDLIDKTGKQLIALEQKVAIAESVTGGMLQLALTSGESASDFFEGGITAYNIDQKCTLLGVDRQHARLVDCVSQEVADAMALHVAQLFRCNWGIAVTGYATPVPESNNDLYAYYAISFNGAIIASGKIESREAAAAEVQQAYCEYILKKFCNQLTEMSTST